MKIKVYTVEEKSPPLNEPLFLWKSEDGIDIDDVPDIVEVHLAICREDELDLLPDGCHPRLQWSKWNYGQEMYYDDLWSYCCLSRGE